MSEGASAEIKTKGELPLAKGVYRCVPSEGYVASFGFQWNKFEQTQIDRFGQGVNQSSVRLFAETAWQKDAMKVTRVLEVGSGAGRFTRALLENTEATVYSVDYSSAVDANFRNNSHFGERLKLFQASIYELPFEPRQFDKVLCLGVLQHTPDFKASIKCLAEMVKPGGELVVDFYPIKGWWTKVHSKYIFRPITTRMSHKRLLRVIESNAAWLIWAYFFFERIRAGRLINRFLPICDINLTLPEGLNAEELKEWVILDTFDMLSPAHDNPQKMKTVAGWVAEAGLEVTFADEVHFENSRASVIRASRRK